MVIDISPEFRTLGNNRYMGSLRGHAGQQLELSRGHVAPLGLYTGRWCWELYAVSNTTPVLIISIFIVYLELN